jgi:hypothetical protein
MAGVGIVHIAGQTLWDYHIGVSTEGLASRCERRVVRLATFIVVRAKRISIVLLVIF